ncbi:mannose-6-phosphate isomerase, class I [Citricoccus muralis]|uniref:mannose-6-phosphate isomerase n=1 Tax=Citricoccus muralis TaxID=169134 RepID=A0A3D9L9M9_9MICC|nr:mannose-6-phosphate isomerase, class I [Citricoccus muralis]REE02346.1 mannose-6-phosphate isomerase type 1 [Citricoccus muralis]
MFLLRTPIRDYAWGSATLLAELQDRTPTGRPEAEMWMGAHPGAPAGAVPASDPESAPVPLDELLASDPETLLGEAARYGSLPFLVKLLAAGRPLSIQAHPALEQARAGFAAEEAADVPVSAPHRNYRDDNHKPEMLVALTPFAALCGFRSAQDAGTSFSRLAQVLAENMEDHDAGPPGLADAAPGVPGAAYASAASTSEVSVAQTVAGYADLLLHGGGEPDRDGVDGGGSPALERVFADLLDPAGDWSSGTWVTAVVAALKKAPRALDEDLNLSTAVGIAEHYPVDPGVLVSILLNRVDLAPGQAIHLPAGNVHAYLHGLGVEVMAASDNVLRGGLTPKHVDVPELRRVVAFESVPVPYCAPIAEGDGHLVFRPPFEEFQVERLDLPAADGTTLTARGPVLAVCTAGRVRVEAGTEAAVLTPGESVFLTAADAAAIVHGTGEEPATLFSVTLP